MPQPIQCRNYGQGGPAVAVLHGGPGAPGHMAAMAQQLATHGFRVLEPLQRRSGSIPLTVHQHILDQHEALRTHFPSEQVALVGSSWGAMLALAFAAEFTERAGPIVLIGCGTFDIASRERFKELLKQRTTPEIEHAFREIEARAIPSDQKLAAKAELLDAIYGVDLLPDTEGFVDVDAAGNRETWDDMLRLQANGTYPQAFSRITAPVLMLHGDADPHPGPMIRDNLLPHIRQLEYREFADCGHYPWRERRAAAEFWRVLVNWLKRTK